MIIYKITNKVNGKIYIGQTIKSLEHRKQQHINCAKRKVDRHLYHSMNKYGIDNFIFEEIDHTDNLKDLNYLETYYIIKYDSVRNGYNMSYGGDNNIMFTDKTKIKHDKIMRSDEVRNKISQSMKQYRQKNPFTEEHRKKLSQAAMGNHNFGTGDTRSIACYCIDENEIRYDFHSYKDGGIWWYENYKPFGEEYHQVTYQRKIVQSIQTGSCSFNGKPIDTNLRWYKSE
jgi:group I intron endonuclease